MALWGQNTYSHEAIESPDQAFFSLPGTQVTPISPEQARLSQGTSLPESSSEAEHEFGGGIAASISLRGADSAGCTAAAATSVLLLAPFALLSTLPGLCPALLSLQSSRDLVPSNLIAVAPYIPHQPVVYPSS